MNESKTLANDLIALLRAKDLLDAILSNFDYYTGEFKLSKYDKSYGEKYSLMNRIREYSKFDDSE